MKTRFNGAALIALVVCVLFCGAALSACTGSYTDPDPGIGSSNGGGGGSGSKPSKLSDNASYAEALAKANELLNNPRVSAEIKTTIESQMKNVTPLNWESVKSEVISAINGVIDSL